MMYVVHSRRIGVLNDGAGEMANDVEEARTVAAENLGLLDRERHAVAFALFEKFDVQVHLRSLAPALHLAGFFQPHRCHPGPRVQDRSRCKRSCSRVDGSQGQVLG